MKTQLSNTCAWICSRLFYLLHNRQAPFYSREEFRLMNMSFSYCGEDLVLLKKINQLKIKDCLYVDVGAYDPIAFSNTNLLHKMGWRGINIDVDQEKIEKFNLLRPSAYNIQAAISNSKSKVKFAKYSTPFTNRIIDLDDPNEKSNLGEKPNSISVIKTCSLNEILENSPFAGQKIGYLDVDCEGKDLEVLESLDFDRYSPEIISVEAFTNNERKAFDKYLNEKNYHISDIVDITTFFCKNS